MDLAAFGSTLLAGKILRILPPAGSAGLHLGSMLRWADLDGNGSEELLLSSALFRPIASYGGYGWAPNLTGVLHGRAYILWDDNFPPLPWSAGFTLDMDALPGDLTTISGGNKNVYFGEQILGGGDFDGNGTADLFISDPYRISVKGIFPGTGYLFFNAKDLRGLNFKIEQSSNPVPVTLIQGYDASAQEGGTVVQGDFDGDGLTDLVFGSSFGGVNGRGRRTGRALVLFGQHRPWRPLIQARPGRLPLDMRFTRILGANGSSMSNTGDTAFLNAATGDMDSDGRTDLIFSEPGGDGLPPSSADTGNLVILSGPSISAPSVP